MKNMKNILKYALAAGIAAVMLASCDLDLVPTTSIAYTPGESPMLTATDAGLANMWIWDFDPSKVRELLPETRNHGIYGLLAIGHPSATDGRPTELHDQRKKLEDIVTEL